MTEIEVLKEILSDVKVIIFLMFLILGVIIGKAIAGK